MQATTDSAPTPTLWQSIGEALRGSHQDYTAGNLNRAILLLAIPMVLEMVLESLFAVVDVFWVSRLGADAIATVGLTESVLTLVFAVGAGAGHVDDGDGRAPHRRERPERRRRLRSPGHLPGTYRFGGARPSFLPLRASDCWP